VEIPALVDVLAADGPLLIDAAQRAGWDAVVPGTDWTVRELVTHVGGVHRWAADIVRTSGATFDTAAGDAVGTGPGDGELAGWFRAGHTALVAALRSAPPDLECATFLPADSPLHFWARRQAHETAMHRVDAEGAAGEPSAIDTAFAQDGIAEILQGFAPRRARRATTAATLGLVAPDGPSWLITMGDARIECVECAELPATDVIVRGTSADLYRWLWNRPAQAVVDGDPAAAALWAGAVRVRWS
jgi:uncharacterized protein (TIGR03083 family)